jgi:hypothetical protein
VEPVTRTYESEPSSGFFSRKSVLAGSLAGLLVILLGALGVVYMKSRPASVIEVSRGTDAIIKHEVPDTHNPMEQEKKPPPIPQVAKFGTLYLTSTPSGADVFIDGEHKGKTPVQLKKVAVGNHLCLAKLRYHQDASRGCLFGWR